MHSYSSTRMTLVVSLCLSSAFILNFLLDLGQYKSQFSHLTRNFLEVTMIPHDVIRKASLPLIFDIMCSEMKETSSFIKVSPTYPILRLYLSQVKVSYFLLLVLQCMTIVFWGKDIKSRVFLNANALQCTYILCVGDNIVQLKQRYIVVKCFRRMSVLCQMSALHCSPTLICHFSCKTS